ncbi:MAG: response regulator [Bdellovibrionota bacterium]
MPDRDPQQKLEIAVIDDEVDILANLRELFESEGYLVRCFSDPEIAFSELSRDPPDLLVTDIAMPGLGGLELLAALRNLVPDMPAVILSGYVDLGNVLKALRLGVTDVVEKPYNEDVLMETVALAASVGRSRRKITRILHDSSHEDARQVFSELQRAQKLLATRIF